MLIVEDGSVVPGAESYCTVAFADSYHSSIGNASWAALTEEQKEQALRKATGYMEQEYFGRWSGERVELLQALSLPRYYMPVLDGGEFAYYPHDEIPSGVMRACAELALKSTTMVLNQDLGRVKTRVKVDVIETEYSQYGRETTQYRSVEMMLKPYFCSGSTYSHKIIRT